MEELKFLIKQKNSYEDIINNTNYQLIKVNARIQELKNANKENNNIIEKKFKTKSGKKINFKVKKIDGIEISGAEKAKNALRRLRKYKEVIK